MHKAVAPFLNDDEVRVGGGDEIVALPLGSILPDNEAPEVEERRGYDHQPEDVEPKADIHPRVALVAGRQPRVVRPKLLPVRVSFLLPPHRDQWNESEERV